MTASNLTVANPFQFTGRENDALAGLYYYRARYYHSGLMRFYLRGPLRRRLLAGGFASYAYAANNPTLLTDPLGLFRVDSSWSSAPFNKSAIEAAAADALDKITNSNCIKSQKLRNDLINIFSKLVIRCDRGLSDCGRTRPRPWGSNSTRLGAPATSELACGPLGSTILHEAVHRVDLLYSTEKRPQASEKSCYGWDPSGEGEKRCAQDCR